MDNAQDAGQHERMTVAEAAATLGISKEAVRKRITRGTLRSYKGPDGTVYVYVPPSGTPSGTEDRDLLYEELRDRVRYVEGQLQAERQAHAEARRIIAGLVEGIPAREAPEAGVQGGDRGTVRDEPEAAPQRPWWRRVLGG